MNSNRNVFNAAIASILTMGSGLVTVAHAVPDQPAEWEK